MKATVKWCRKHGACEEAVRWIAQYDTLEEAWENCDRADWMLWALKAIDYKNDKQLRLYACKCARDVWDKMTDERSRNAVRVAERYARGKATDEELSAACSAAYSAAWSEAYDAARSDAYSVAKSAAKSAARSAAWSAAWSETYSEAYDAASDTDGKKLAIRLRRMIGNPFAGK